MQEGFGHAAIPIAIFALLSSAFREERRPRAPCVSSEQLKFFLFQIVCVDPHTDMCAACMLQVLFSALDCSGQTSRNVAVHFPVVAYLDFYEEARGSCVYRWPHTPER